MTSNPFHSNELLKSVSNYPVKKGDVPGHEFHGNQYQDGQGGGENLTPSGHRPIADIASDIRRDWSKQGKGVWFGAKPYLDAMGSLHDIKDNYYDDSAKSVVNYFLANAATWKGDTARSIKAELKSIVQKG